MLKNSLYANPQKSIYIRLNKFLRFLFYLYIVISFYEAYLNQIIGPITKYYLLLLIVIYFFNYKKIKFEIYHIFIILWLIFKIASISWGSYNFGSTDTVLTHLFSQIGMVLLFIVLTIVSFERDFIRKIIKVLFFSSLSMAVLGIFFSEPFLYTADSRQVLTLFGTQNDPNNTAAFYLVGITIALYYIVFEKKNIYVYIFFILINTYALSLTASRGGLITLGTILICTIVLFDKNIIKVFKKLVFTCISVILVYLLMKEFLSELVFNRLFGFETYEGGSGREELWSSAISLLKEKPLVGWGWGGYTSGIHNTYLSMFSDIGIIGFTLFFASLFLIFIKAVEMRMPLAILILITGLVPSIFIDAINKRFFWNAIIIAAMIINSNMSIPINMKSYSVVRKKGNLK